MAKQDQVVKLLMIEDSVDEAEHLISMLRNGGIAVRPARADNTDALCGLSERLFEVGVTPYYLHQLDRVAGAGHFAVPDSRALELIAAVRQRLSGYLVPRLVREVAGETSKTPL